MKTVLGGEVGGKKKKWIEVRTVEGLRLKDGHPTMGIPNIKRPNNPSTFFNTPQRPPPYPHRSSLQHENDRNVTKWKKQAIDKRRKKVRYKNEIQTDWQ
jgi:hypothetical protein